MLLLGQTSVGAIEGQGGTSDLLWACFTPYDKPRHWTLMGDGTKPSTGWGGRGGKTSWFLGCSPPPETVQHTGES